MQFESQYSVYFAFPFTQEIIQHKDMYCLKLFLYSFIHYLFTYTRQHFVLSI